MSRLLPKSNRFVANVFLSKADPSIMGIMNLQDELPVRRGMCALADVFRRSDHGIANPKEYILGEPKPKGPGISSFEELSEKSERLNLSTEGLTSDKYEIKGVYQKPNGPKIELISGLGG